MTPVAARLLNELTQMGVELVPNGDRLRYRPKAMIGPEMAERLRIHKVALLALLRSTAGSSDPWDVDSIDPLHPCSVCGSLELWETLWGRWRCLRCDPPNIAREAAIRAARLRRRK